MSLLSQIGGPDSDNILIVEETDEDGDDRNEHKIKIENENEPDKILRIVSYQIDLELVYKNQERILLLKCIKQVEDMLDVLSRLIYYGKRWLFLSFQKG